MASNRNFRDTTQSPDVQDEGDSGGGGVSPRLLEQLNSARLDQISNSMKIISEKIGNPESKPTLQGGGMGNGLQSFLKWAGLLLSFVIAIVGAVTWINATIDSKTRENRIEMKADLDSAKTEIKAEVFRTQDSVNRLDEKIDRKMDKLSDQLTAIQQDLRDTKMTIPLE